MAQNTQPRRWNVARLTRLIWLPGLCLVLAACHLDMYQQPKGYPNDPSTFFPDGRLNRPPVPNTVAIGQFQSDPHFLQGTLADGSPATELPPNVKLDDRLLAYGRTRYEAFCMPCHGLVGDGQGIIAQRGPLTVPSLHQERLRTAPVGYFYGVITNGVGRMYGLASRVPPEDRWAIVAYVRALQLSQNASIDDVPPDQRGLIESGR
ncbi:MAG: cytochrome c [Chloroflexaceae bacterium]|jgi:mono/diheme cytochrome c family protein|nr:cytochrome c [Chloroflexaceae bacterium]